MSNTEYSDLMENFKHINFKDTDMYSMSFNDINKLTHQLVNMKEEYDLYINAKELHEKQLDAIKRLASYNLYDPNSNSRNNKNDLLKEYISQLNIEKNNLDKLKYDYNNNYKNILNMKVHISDIVNKLHNMLSMINDLDSTTNDVNSVLPNDIQDNYNTFSEL